MCAWRGAGLQPQQQQASCQTSGIPPLVHSAVLTDRRHILSKDAEGNVDLWDIATGAVQQHFGQVWIVTGSVCCHSYPLYTTTVMLGTDCSGKARAALHASSSGASPSSETPHWLPASPCTAPHASSPSLPCSAYNPRLMPVPLNAELPTV